MNLSCLFRITLALMLSAGLNACMAVQNTIGQSIMTNTINSQASPPTVAATFCMGRFLVDMPVGSNLTAGNYKYDFIQIEPVKAMSFAEFEMEVKEKEARLKAIKHKVEPSLLRQSLQLDKNTKLITFWEESYVDSVVNFEGYKWIDSIRFFMKVDVGISKHDAGITRITDTLSRLRPRADTDIPTDPGYCFEGGFIANPRWRNEEAGVDLSIPGHPDAQISVWFYPLAGHKQDKPLLERMGGMVQFLGKLATSVRVLRQGDREVASFKGQEHLASAPSSGGMRGHAFVWETQGDGTLDTPRIKIELTTGGRDRNGNPQQTKLTNEQAIKLWDEILGSFRLRPTGGAAATSQIAPAPLQPRLALGELAATGRICPQTGWWQPSEAGEVEGGRRQRFAAGAVMPHVVLRGEPSMWQKLKGEQPTRQTATVWQLVDYDEALPSADASMKLLDIAQAAPDAAAAQPPEAGASRDEPGHPAASSSKG